MNKYLFIHVTLPIYFGQHQPPTGKFKWNGNYCHLTTWSTYMH